MPAAGTLTLGSLIAAPADIRDVVVYELLGDPLRFWPFAHDATLMSGTSSCPGDAPDGPRSRSGGTIEKGTYKGGRHCCDGADFEHGRRVLLTDGQPVTGTRGRVGHRRDARRDERRVCARPATIRRLRKIALSGDVAIPLTVLASRRIGPTVTFPNARRELTVTIGSFPPQTIVLAGALTGAGADRRRWPPRRRRRSAPLFPARRHSRAPSCGRPTTRWSSPPASRATASSSPRR